MIDDLAEHLAEVAAEGPGRLVDRLGPPDVYAAELQTAAGFGPSIAVPNVDDRIRVTRARIRARLHRLDVRVGAFIGYAKASDFLRLLRPGWWVLRGYLAAMLATVAHADDYGLLPQLDNSVVAGLLLLAVTVAGSIWLGRRTSGFPRRWRLAVNAGSAVAAVFGLAMLLTARAGWWRACGCSTRTAS